MNIDPIIKKILEKRNIISEEDIREFLSPRPVKTYDPFLMDDMEESVDLILKTIEEGGRICIYGDYDSDGVHSICIMMTVLRQLTSNVTYYIPSRFNEGYGLNKEAIARIKEEGTDLMITVDCGSTSCEEVAYAHDIGLEVIVTDHHTMGNEMPDCLLLNPKRPNSHYPFSDLAGCGVAYKLCQALQRKAGFPRQTILDILDFVAIGTVGDIVPLRDENRTLVKYGLSKINYGGRENLITLLNGISLHPGSIDSENISFGIVPHINSAGRMGTAEIGVKLLLAENKNDAMLMTEILKGYNNNRKEEQEKAYKMCTGLMREQCPDDLMKIIYAEKAHEGITGIVAGKIKDDVKKPVLIVTPLEKEPDVLKGTGRCIDTLNLYDLLKTQQELFSSFGGHKGACGFRLKRENLDQLRKGMAETMGAIDPALLDPDPVYDLEITTGQATMELADRLEALAPFGQENNRPRFRFSNVYLQNARRIGANGKHASFTINSGNGNLKCIYFNGAEKVAAQLSTGLAADVYGELNVNVWNGYRNLQVIIRDIQTQGGIN